MIAKKDNLIIIPAYNEEATISDIVKKLIKKSDVLVVDDGSSDNTAIDSVKSGAKILTHNVNLGYDAAIYSGLEYAIAHKYQFAITLDADGQHDTKLVDIFLQELNSGIEIVIGKREKKQRIAEKIFAIATSIIWNIRDPLCGMKGYKIASIGNISPLKKYETIGSVYAILAVQRGSSFKQIGIFTSDRKDKPRFGTGWGVNLKILRSLIELIYFMVYKNNGK